MTLKTLGGVLCMHVDVVLGGNGVAYHSSVVVFVLLGRWIEPYFPGRDLKPLRRPLSSNFRQVEIGAVFFCVRAMFFFFWPTFLSFCVPVPFSIFDPTKHGTDLEEGYMSAHLDPQQGSLTWL